MSNKYNSKLSTFKTAPLLNALWSALNDGTGVGVTPGADDWEPQAGDFSQGQFFNQLDGASSNQLKLFQNKNDLGFIKTFTPWCNFADGLVDISDSVVTNPQDIGETKAIATLSNNLAFKIQANFVNENSEVIANSDIVIPFMGWNVPINVNLKTPQVLDTLKSKGQNGVLNLLLGVEVIVTGEPLFSTISINSSFSSKRVLCWATLDYEHSNDTVSS